MGFRLKYNSFAAVVLTLLFSAVATVGLAQRAKEVARIPFESENGTIILTVKLNDFTRPLRLLFDTGADGMAVEQSLADSIGLKVSRTQKASVVGGTVDISVSAGNTVHMGDFPFKNQSIAIFKEMHKGADGIIGNTIARHYITKIDYDKKEMVLFSFGDYQYEKGGSAVAFTMPSGIFIIPGALSITTEPAHKGNFVFDTGASYSLICFRPFVKQNKLLVSGFKSEYNGATVSMGMSTPTFSGKAATFSFADMPVIKNLPVTLMAGGGQSESWNPGFDGSIGVRLISRYNFTINMQKKEIYMNPNKTYNYPRDFAIGGFLFGFSVDGVLEVISLTAPENPKLSLKAGVKIKSLNGVSSSTLLKDIKQLQKLLDMPIGTNYKIESLQNGNSIIDLIVK